MNLEERVQNLIREAEDSARLRRTMTEALAESIIELANLISGVIGSGGKLLICGNGGSAAESSHLATEMIVRLTAHNNREPLPAMALCTDSSIITAAGNDFGFENIFARQIQGLGHKGDILLLISTSGNSPNLLRATAIAREMGILTVALLGNTGGKLAGMVDQKLIVPHHSVQRIQEEHLFIIHLLVELIESDLMG